MIARLRELLTWLSRAARRYLANTPANVYEELVFSSLRQAATIYGGRRVLG